MGLKIAFFKSSNDETSISLIFFMILLVIRLFNIFILLLGKTKDIKSTGLETFFNLDNKQKIL